MLFLLELDSVRPAQSPSPEAGRTLIEQVIFPTIARAEQLAAEGNIVSGGAVAGRIALRFMIEAESLEEADRVASRLPLWSIAETRLTPLIALSERRDHVQRLLEGLVAGR